MTDALPFVFGPEICGSLDAGARREWIVTDGLGGFAMGTVSGLRTRRYHGLLTVATRPPIGRMLGLAALDPVLVIGDRRVRLAVHEWAGGTIDPSGHLLLAAFDLRDGVPRWRWTVGDVVIEREIAMVQGRPCVAVVHRILRTPGPVRLELPALCTWRDANGERYANGEPAVEPTPDGFVFEGAYRVAADGAAFEPGGEWYRGVRYRVEAERGLNDREDLWFAGTFSAQLAPGEALGVRAWAGDPGAAPAADAVSVVDATRIRSAAVIRAAGSTDPVDATLALAADRQVVIAPNGPTVVAGYPWFGDWSRDTMTSYEGLFLETGRSEQGRMLLEAAAAGLSQGMLANTSDVGGTEYNTVDGTLWFLHAIGRHVERTGDLDLAAALLPGLRDVVEAHVAGTRYGIHVDPADGLLAEGADGLALTWMDARVDGRPVTPRAGKPVEVNALWINGLATVAGLQERLGQDAARTRALEAIAGRSFAVRFAPAPDGRLPDAIDAPDQPGDSAGRSFELRPNQLLAASLPFAPVRDPGPVHACAPLLTPLGLRSLAPDDSAYLAHHRGGPAERDHAYHQGTVWPWLIGPYVEASLRTGAATDGLDGALDGLAAHLSEWGLGSISETADGEPPHDATGCPFQAWSVAEVLRARRLLTRGVSSPNAAG